MTSRCIRFAIIAASFIAAIVLATASVSGLQASLDGTWDEARFGSLPRWRDGGTPPIDPGLPTRPFAIRFAEAEGDVAGPPTSGLIASPPEYSPSDGVIFRFSTNSWAQVVVDCVAALTGDPSHDEKAFVVVANASQQASASNQFSAAGADQTKVVFIIQPTDSIWLRDYGPHFIWQSGTLGIADSHYYPTRPRDNFIPSLLAENQFGIPGFHMGLYFSGGNFQPGPARSGFITSLINQDNGGFPAETIEALYQTYQGIDTLHVFPRLPGNVDGTGHIDMWFYLVDEDTVIISEFLPGSNATAIQVTNDAVPYMQALGFEVHRLPAWNQGGTHYTYANAFRVNDRIFTPKYGGGNPAYLDEDAQALAAWQAAAGPGVEIIPIECSSIIPASGAIHCIMMQVPRHTDSTPTAHVVNPDGGELLTSGSEHEIRWAACDDDAIASVELSWSDDGGLSFPHLIASGEPNDGRFDWTVPLTESDAAVVRVRAFDSSAQSADAVSESTFEVAALAHTDYDFSVGAGVDRWAWGHSTPNWSSVGNQRHPSGAATEIEVLVPGAYAALAASDATGGDGDSRRYRSPVPGGGGESTHVFEFSVAEQPWAIRDIGVFWEGYADNCAQTELYVWDANRGAWGDGAGNVGENAYMANYAGNRDEPLEGHVRDGFGRYVDLDGRITLLLYAERSGQETFHDQITLRVIHDVAASNPWELLGHGKSGTHGTPEFVGQGTLAGGDLVGLSLSGALESAPTWLVIGLSRIDGPLFGGTLVPSPDVIMPGFVTAGAGNLDIESAWPVGLPPGFEVFLQAWVEDPAGIGGWSASNGLSGTTP